MAEIPYTGAPDRVPQLEATPAIHVDAPPAAFGTNIAEQIQHLGQVQENAGKEMFDRAYALQEFKVHADVNQRLTDMQNGMTDLTKNYLSQQGKNAVDGYPAYRQGLDDIRTQGGQGLSPYGQEMYDNESRQWQYRNSLTGADHSAQQLKAYNDQTQDARIKSAKESISTSPASDAIYDANIKTIHDTLNTTALSEGWSKDKLDQVTHDVTSEALLDRAHSLGLTQPQQAMDLLNKAISRKDVSGDRVEKELGFLSQKIIEVGSRNIAHAVALGANLQYGEKVVDAPSARLATKANEGGNYTQGMDPKFRLIDKNGNYPLGAYSIMNNNLSPWLKEAGMPDMTEDQFLHDKDAQDKLFDFKFGQMMEKDGSYNAAYAEWFTGNSKASLDASDGHHTLRQQLQIANGTLAKGASLADRQAAGSSMIDATDPGNEGLREETQRRIATQYDEDKKTISDTNFQQAKSVYDAINNGVGPQHKLPTTPEELQTDPQARAAWDYFATNDPGKLGAFRRALNNNAKEDVGETPERSEEYSRLRGMAINPAGRKEFMNVDVNALDLPLKWKRVLSDMQAKVHKDVDAAPQVNHAVQVLKPMLDNINLTRQADAGNYDTFVGTLHEIMSKYQLDNDKPMNDEEITKAGTRLLSGQQSGLFSSTPPWFEKQELQEVPPEAADIIRRLPQWGGAMPSEEQVHQMWIAKQYQAQWGQKAGQQ